MMDQYSQVIDRIAKSICRVENQRFMPTEKSLNVLIEGSWKKYRQHAIMAYREIMNIDTERMRSHEQ